MSKEKLFDFLCNHFGEDYKTAESVVFYYLYDYLIFNNLETFLQHLKSIRISFQNMYMKSESIIEKITYICYIHAILKVMNFINVQLGEEIYK